MTEYQLPASRCPHGYKAPEEKAGPWFVPVAPKQCGLCQRADWSGTPYRLDGGLNPEPKGRPPTEPCPKEGCILSVTPGEQHSAPCLIPDQDARDPDRPLSVEINNSPRWHSPKSWEGDYHVVAHCGLAGRPTSAADSDIVECKTCRRRRAR